MQGKLFLDQERDTFREIVHVNANSIGLTPFRINFFTVHDHVVKNNFAVSFERFMTSKT